MILEAFAQALLNFGDPWFLISMFGGVIVGLILGLIPGLSGMVGLTLFLPFVFALPREYALPFMLAMDAVTYTGGSITAILLNVPGTGVNVATLQDGFPMSQKGEGGRAIGAALTSSGMGGLVSAGLALAMVPLVLPLVMAITSADMVFLVLLGISFIGVLSAGSRIKGLISGGLGLMIAFIGMQSMTGLPRFTFGSLYLYDGIDMAPLGLGLFALPEMITFATRGGTIAKAGVAMKGMRDVVEGAKDVFRHWWLWLRCTVIGYVIGVIPGIGASTSIWMAYGQAKQTSKYPERFGTGVVEGVIAPESANNAKEGGALLTTMALGVPGSETLAVILGALLMVGLIPGPPMMIQHLDLSLTLLLTIIVANIIGVIICFPLAQHLVKVANVPSNVLAPIIFIIVFAGVFASEQQMADVIVALVFAVLGLAMKRYGYSRPALFLGYVLGLLFEKYFFIAFSLSGPLFFVRPISLVLISIVIVLLTYGPLKRLFQRQFRGRGGRT